MAVAGYFYNELNCILCDTTSYEPPERHDDDGLIRERLYDTFKCVYHVYEMSPFERPADAIFMTDVSGLTEWVHENPMLIPEVYLKAVNTASISLLYFQIAF